MLSAQTLDLIAAERARRGLTVPVDQMLLWAAIMMDMARGPMQRLSRSENVDQLVRAIRQQITADPRAPGTNIVGTNTESTPSLVLADALEEAGIPGAHVVRWHANNPADAMRSRGDFTHTLGGRQAGPLLLSETPQSVHLYDTRGWAGHPLNAYRKTALADTIAYAAAGLGKYRIHVGHTPHGETPMNAGVAHGAVANSWEELVPLIADFPRWAKKMIVQHAVRAFGKPGKPNVRKLARPDEDRHEQSDYYSPTRVTQVQIPGGKAGEKTIAKKADAVAGNPHSFMNILTFMDHLNEAVPNHPGSQALQSWLKTGKTDALRAHFATNPTDAVSGHIKRALATHMMAKPIKLSRRGDGTATLANYADGGKVSLFHFADPSLAHEASFTTDPGKFGKNPHSASERKVEGTPKTFFYTDLRDKESFFGGKPLFRADYPVDKIYDAAADPEGHVERAVGGLTGLIRKLRESGYHGIFYSGVFPTVAMWEPVTVHKHEEAPQKLSRPRSHVYVSSNTREGTQMQDAYRMASSPEHGALMAATPGGRSGYGVWLDGAEDARMFPVSTPDQLAVVADSLGKQFKQKAVATFNEHTGGADALHVLTVRENDPEKVHRETSEHGIEHKTILPSPEGLEIHILDPGKQLDDAVESYASGRGARVTHHEGTVEFRPTK